MIAIQLPNGGQTRTLVIDDKSAPAAEMIQFECITYLGDYDAFVLKDEGIIEARITLLDQRSIFLLQRFSDRRSQSGGDEVEIEEEPSSPNEKFTPISDFTVSNYSTGTTIEFGHSHGSLVSKIGRIGSSRIIRISGFEHQTHDQTLSLLTRLSSSYFFNLNLETGIAISLRKQTKLKRFTKSGHRCSEKLELGFPAYEYDEEPLSLYWYALSATGMPLLEFLALYQVLEYYFPIYSKKEAGRQIRCIIKDPTFRPEKETDIGRLLAVVSSSSHGRIGNERQQLKATLGECIVEDELLMYLQQESERTDFFSKPQKRLTSHKVLSGKPLAVNLDRLADAIYDIRCKIVHSKMDEADIESSGLLPFSEEAELLKQYIELMKWLAQKVLIASSSKFDH